MSDKNLYRSICDKCVLHIIRAVQDMVHNPLPEDASLEKEVVFIEEETGDSLRLYMKLTREEKKEND